VKAFPRVLSLWIVLVALAWLLSPAAERTLMDLRRTMLSSSPIAPPGSRWVTLQIQCGWLLLPIIAVWLTARAVAAIRPASRLVRVLFWATASGGWLAVCILARGRSEPVSAGTSSVLYAAFGIAALAACWWCWKSRRELSWRAFRDVLAGVAWLIVVVGMAAAIWAWADEKQTRSIMAEAKWRWESIGHSMDEFAKTVAVTHDNAGSNATRTVLHEVVGPPLSGRRSASAEASRAAVRVDGEVKLLLPGDSIGLPAPAMAELAPFVPKLTRAYETILEAEPAVWKKDPAEVFARVVPDRATILVFSHLVGADALRRDSAGDANGSARAIAAAVRIKEGLCLNPSFFCLSDAAKMEATLAPYEVRLPSQGDGFATLMRDVAARRAQMVIIAQQIYLVQLRDAERDRFVKARFRWGYLPGWAEQMIRVPYGRRASAEELLRGAAHLEILKSEEALRLPDFGESRHKAISGDKSGWGSLCVSMRMEIHASLLLREQVEMIREARRRLAEGRELESRDSVVLPGVRWEISTNAQKDAVFLRLANAPAWIASWRTSNFSWVLPLDGSVPWQFAPSARPGGK